MTTVRSQEKADNIKRFHPKVSPDQLSSVIVRDIAQKDAFAEVVKSDPPFEIVIHTASPFHFNTKNPQKDLVDPAVVGTTDILKLIKKHAPTVTQVVSADVFCEFQFGAPFQVLHTRS